MKRYLESRYGSSSDRSVLSDYDVRPARGGARSRVTVRDESAAVVFQPAPAEEERLKREPSPDLEVPRRQLAKQEAQDQDLEVPRRRRSSEEAQDEDLEVPRRRRSSVEDQDQDLEVPRKRRAVSSGLHTADQLDALDGDREIRRRRLEEAGDGEELPETVFRDPKTGKKLTLAELEQREAEAKKRDEKRKRPEWGKGLVQLRQQIDNAKHRDSVKEQGFTRYKDDLELNDIQRSKTHWDDPLLKAQSKISSSSSSAGAPNSAAVAASAVRPVYRGNPFPNRFGILPGYRWDGVDRSNGWERKRFMIINEKSANQQEAYLWAVEDM